MEIMRAMKRYFNKTTYILLINSKESHMFEELLDCTHYFHIWHWKIHMSDANKSFPVRVRDTLPLQVEVSSIKSAAALQ